MLKTTFISLRKKSINVAGEKIKNVKNHWSKIKVDNVTKKIDQEIYKRNRQAPIHIKMNGTLEEKISKKAEIKIKEELAKRIEDPKPIKKIQQCSELILIN